MKALLHAMPGNVSAGIGNLKVIAFLRPQDETPGAHGDLRGSYGGRWARTAWTPSTRLYANTRNNPIEDIETHLPLRVLRTSCRGRARAGNGAAAWARCASSPFSRRRASVEGEATAPAMGLFGGQRGMPAKLDLLRWHDARAGVEGAAHEHRQGWPLRLLRPRRRRLRQSLERDLAKWQTTFSMK